jgi:Kef-type K+ transport system membrane component KefB
MPLSFATLALVILIGLSGPALAWSGRIGLPVVLGELAGGIVTGSTGLRWVHSTNPTLTFLANLGFALVMFVAGTHVPVRDPKLRTGARRGLVRAIGVAVVSAAVGIGLASAFHTGHPALYAVLMASSSAAVVLPSMASLGLQGDSVLALLPQVAIADAACIVALPLAIDPHRAVRAGLGALAVCGCAVLAFGVLRWFYRSHWRKLLRRVSRQRGFALELRVNLALLFGLAALASRTEVSILLAGFSFGLVIAAVGEPRRLARQVFALTEGFLGPLFFVWLGASLDLRELGRHPSYIGLGVALGAGAVGCHLVGRIAGQPIGYGVLASAQLGVPVAAATLGAQRNLLHPGEAPALVLGALITIGAAAVAGAVLARSQHAQTGRSGVANPRPRENP